MAASVASWRPCQARPREVPAWQGFSRPLGHLEGTWLNVDCPNEQYVIEGLRVRRTDARGESEFTIQWNQSRQLWQWGTHGRLSLHWLGADVIAWVPDGPHDPHHTRAWRWRRCEPVPPPPRRVTPPEQPMSSGYRPHRHPRNAGHHNNQPYSNGRPWRGSQRDGEAHRDQESSRGHRHSHRSGHRYRNCDYHGGGQGSQSGSHRGRGRHGGADVHPNLRLPCGLTAAEVYSLLSRDITPEDYDLLLRLDEMVAKPTVSADSVRDLPQADFQEFQGHDCGVCLSALEAKDCVVGLPCRHYFHQECVSKWLSQCRKTCPLCCAEVEGGGGGGGPE